MDTSHGNRLPLLFARPRVAQGVFLQQLAADMAHWRSRIQLLSIFHDEDIVVIVAMQFVCLSQTVHAS